MTNDPLDVMHIDEARFEWANAKCRWAAYFGSWPAWVDDITVPNESHVALLLRQWTTRRNSSEWERIKTQGSSAA